MKVVMDIECNGLYEDVTKMWCAVTHCLENKETKIFSDYSEQIVDGGVQEFIDYIHQADTLICHNIIGYDLPVLEKLFGYKYEGDVIDTLIYSKFLWFTRPKVRGYPTPHSLGAWGVRTGISKPSQEQWLEWEEAMLTRCSEDVRINTVTYERLMLEKSKQPLSDKPLEVEHEIAKICFQQYLNGWLADKDKLEDNIVYLDKKISELEDYIEPEIPPYVKIKDGYCTWEECNKIMGNPFKKVPKTKLDHLGNLIRPAAKPFNPKVLKS